MVTRKKRKKYIKYIHVSTINLIILEKLRNNRLCLLIYIIFFLRYNIFFTKFIRDRNVTTYVTYFRDITLIL